MFTLSSLGHSPGTTTTAVALSMRWPRPCLLIEADTSSTSSILAGRFRGQVPHRSGLTGLASAALHGELDPALVWAHTIELSEDRRVVPGFSTLGAARGAASFWAHLAGLLSAFDDAGCDLLIDLGRCDAPDPRSSLIAKADLAIVATGATLPDIAATTAPLQASMTRLRELGAVLVDVGNDDGLRLAVIDRARENYSAAEIRRATGVPVLGVIPHAPDAAAVYSLGAVSGRHGPRGPLPRAIDTLAEAALGHVRARRARLRAPAPGATPAPTTDDREGPRR